MSLRPIRADRLIKALAKVGFKPVRRRGSHVILKHDDGRVTVVPVFTEAKRLGEAYFQKSLRMQG